MRREGVLFSHAFANGYIQAMILLTWVQWRSHDESPSLARYALGGVVVLPWRSMGPSRTKTVPGHEMR